MSNFEAFFYGLLLGGALVMGYMGSTEPWSCDKTHTRMKVKKTLPEICAPFYNDGTGRWIECMGVGLK